MSGDVLSESWHLKLDRISEEINFDALEYNETNVASFTWDFEYNLRTMAKKDKKSKVAEKRARVAAKTSKKTAQKAKKNSKKNADDSESDDQDIDAILEEYEKKVLYLSGLWPCERVLTMCDSKHFTMRFMKL